MNILADANVESMTISTLRNSGYNVYEIKQAGLPDPKVGEIAGDKNALIITNDVQTFVYENYKTNGFIPQAGIVELRLKNLSNEAIAKRVDEFIKKEGDSLSGKVTVLEPASERIREISVIEKDIKAKEALKEEKEKTKIAAERKEIESKAKGQEGVEKEEKKEEKAEITNNATERKETLSDLKQQQQWDKPVKATITDVEKKAVVANEALMKKAAEKTAAIGEQTLKTVTLITAKTAEQVSKAVASVTPVTKAAMDTVTAPMKAAAEAARSVSQAATNARTVVQGIKRENQEQKQLQATEVRIIGKGGDEPKSEFKVRINGETSIVKTKESMTKEELAKKLKEDLAFKKSLIEQHREKETVQQSTSSIKQSY